MTNAQIEQYTAKVDGFMSKYPTITCYDKLKDVEKQTGYPAAYFFVAGFCLLTGILTLLGGAKLLVDVTGFVYPAYMSFKSMDGASKDDTQWLTYWVVFSAFSIAETVFSFVTLIIPMYFWLKIAVIVWMWYPTTRGAQTIYEQVLRPIILPYLETGKAQ